MPGWLDFEREAPELAAFGAARLSRAVAYLGTVRPDGGPRVHPVTPIVGAELYLFMEPTSPKGKDLLRDPRYTLHCGVEDNEGGGGEFYVRGRAAMVGDAAERERAITAASYAPHERYVLFRLSIDFAFMNTYPGGAPAPRRWQSADETP